MSDVITASPSATALAHSRNLPRPLAGRLASALGKFDFGTLHLEFPGGQTLRAQGRHPGPNAVVKMVHWRTLRQLLTAGDIGFADAYLSGDWTTPDLKELFAWAHANERALTPAWKGTLWQRLTDRVAHWRRANTRRGSRRNIAAHYDLGNDFYSAWLDETLCYSSALFADPQQDLHEAQLNKISRIGELLDVEKGTRVLEIGCGWGALAQHLIAKGAAVTGITLSNEQLAIARERVMRADPSGQSDIVFRDYRDVTGTFDRIVSIEMFEAAGEAYWPLYFRKLRECLKPGGIAVLQVITIHEDRFEGYRRRPDFIQRHIFPGGMLPTISHLNDLTRAAGLTMEHQEHFAASYARTLAIWRERFLAAHPTLRGDVASDRFRRLWEYYLAYCEVGFENGAVDVGLYRIRG